MSDFLEKVVVPITTALILIRQAREENDAMTLPFSMSLFSLAAPVVILIVPVAIGLRCISYDACAHGSLAADCWPRL